EAVGADAGVVGDDVHVEAASAAGDLRPHAAESEEAEGLAAQLAPHELAPVPTTLAQGAMGGGDVASQAHHQGQGVLGGGDGVGGGSVNDDDTAPGGRMHIDVVDASPGATDNNKVASSVQYFVGNLCFAAHYEPLVARQDVKKLRRAKAKS